MPTIVAVPMITLGAYLEGSTWGDQKHLGLPSAETRVNSNSNVSCLAPADKNVNNDLTHKSQV